MDSASNEPFWKLLRLQDGDAVPIINSYGHSTLKGLLKPY
jgi:hypothetical protein